MSKVPCYDSSLSRPNARKVYHVIIHRREVYTAACNLFNLKGFLARILNLDALGDNAVVYKCGVIKRYLCSREFINCNKLKRLSLTVIIAISCRKSFKLRLSVVDFMVKIAYIRRCSSH